MFDFEVAFYLYKMSKIQEVFLDSKYSSEAYFSAAMAIDAYETLTEELYREKRLREIAHVGAKIEKCIIEIIETQRLTELEDLEKRFFIEDYSLLLSYGLSVKLLRKLWNLGIKNAATLRLRIAEENHTNYFTSGELKKIRCFLDDYNRVNGKYLISYGYCLGRELIERLRCMTNVSRAILGEQIISSVEYVQRIDVDIDYEGSLAVIGNELEKSARYKSINIKDNTIKGNTAFGIPFIITCRTEEFWQSCLQLTDKELVCVYGDLHSHTTWSDGIHSIEQMADSAKKLGHQYLAITDHSISEKQANGMADFEALTQVKKIHEFNESSDIKLLSGIEVDILKDGSLDYSDEVLDSFDIVVAAIHQTFNQDSNAIMRRLEKALSNPYVNILAHPTGRLLGRPGILFSDRDGYIKSMEKLISLCRENNVALEVNCFPERLDLSTDGIRLAAEKGVKISLGTDSHSCAHLSNIKYGLALVEKAGIDQSMLLNTMKYQELKEYVSQKRSIASINNTNYEFKAIKKDSLKKDFDYYFGNNISIIDGEATIIGIDLTSKEDKESGWAYLKGKEVKTRRVATDAELISSIEQIHPDIVSIDSPLAYPKGRVSTSKTSPDAKYGIMRECERLLRHFGINVYPALIDSMIKMTTRGMLLARELRSRGFTVIESYPGVAQDVLKIPRKGKSKEQHEHLKLGLSSFGICGDLIDNPNISHDEVDAITSALVGYFYLNNQYVALGNEAEDYLIVPRIQDEILKKRIIIGLGGESGAGKTTTAEYLRFKYGLKSCRYSQVIAEKYGGNSKEELQIIGAEISKKENTQRALTEYMIEKMDPNVSYVIDGLRHVIDYKTLKNHFGDDFIFVGLECSYKNRYKRYNADHFNVVSLEEFDRINYHEAEMDIVLVQMFADYHIDNNKSFYKLREAIDEIISKECGV